MSYRETEHLRVPTTLTANRKLVDVASAVVDGHRLRTEAAPSARGARPLTDTRRSGTRLHCSGSDGERRFADSRPHGLQHVGFGRGWTALELEGEPNSFTARFRAPDGRLVAALCANRPRETADLRRELAVA
jgi:hypothetical protein